MENTQLTKTAFKFLTKKNNQSTKRTPLQHEEIAGSLYFVPELCDFCKGSKICAPCRHICTVQVTGESSSSGCLHPVTKDMICSLVTFGECQAEVNDSPSNACLLHWKLKFIMSEGSQGMYYVFLIKIFAIIITVDLNNILQKMEIKSQRNQLYFFMCHGKRFMMTCPAILSYTMDQPDPTLGVAYCWNKVYERVL